MRIMNNITAMNTYRQYNIANKETGKSAEKLSSGYRINRAGDDAAGLAISEKMRAQIRGLTMASKNSEDAISLVQTAEGALQETHNILQRMRELAVQSASDTNEQVIDRGALQAEFSQLKEEIDVIAGVTTFNDQKLIDGTFSESRFNIKKGSADTFKDTGVLNSSANASKVDISLTHNIHAGTYKVSVVSVPVGFSAGKIPSGTIAPPTLSGGATVAWTASFKAAVGETDAYNTAGFTLSYTDGVFTLTNKDNPNDIYTARFDPAAKIPANSGQSLTFTNSAGNALGTMNITFRGDIQTNDIANQFDDTTLSFSGGRKEVSGSKEVAYYLRSDGAADVQVRAGDTSVTFNNGISLRFDALTGSDLETAATSNAPVGTVTVEKLDGKSLTIQVGANQGDEMKINVDKMNSKWLGIVNSKISTQVDASRAITEVNDALNVVSTQRAKLGALQNRLEHKIANLDTSAENLTAAESRIRDVDMAKEMTKFTKANILVQASTSMLAQANSAPQNVLQLLR